jgi:hypothetical protein
MARASGVRDELHSQFLRMVGNLYVQFRQEAYALVANRRQRLFSDTLGRGRQRQFWIAPLRIH